VAQLGFIERENAAILNASIGAFAQRTIRGFQLAMRRLGLRCPLYITQVRFKSQPSTLLITSKPERRNAHQRG
jgi:hypothetical protein